MFELTIIIANAFNLYFVFEMPL